MQSPVGNRAEAGVGVAVSRAAGAQALRALAPLSQLVNVSGSESQLAVFETYVATNWLVVALGILALVLAVALFLVGRRRPTLRYAVWGINLISDLDSRVPLVSLTYSGRKVSTVSVTKLTLWNSGREAIRGSDIVDSDLLRVSLSSEQTILGATVLAVTNKAIGVTITEDPQSAPATLGFKFMNPGDGATIQVIHTSANPFNVWLEGTLVNAAGPKRVGGMSKILLYAWLAGFMVVLVLVLRLDDSLPQSGVFGFLGLLLVMGVIGAYLAPVIRVADIRNLVPKELKSAAWGFPGWRPR